MFYQLYAQYNMLFG